MDRSTLPSDRQSDFVRKIRSCADIHVAPRTAEWDRQGLYPREALRELGRIGAFGLTTSEAFNGSSGTWGGDSTMVATVVREVSTYDATCGLMVSIANSLTCPILGAYAPEDVRARFLPGAATGEITGAFALTEPQAGSDAARIAAAAERTSSGFRLNGTKTLITAGSCADILFVFARTGEGARGLSCFLVPSDTPGVRIVRKLEKMGMRGSDTCELSFDNVEIPAEYILGAAGDGYRIALESLSRSRIGISAQAAGIAEAALSHALAHAKRRVTFGRPLIEHQAIAFMLADMQVDVEASWQMTLAAARMKDAGLDCGPLSAMSKLFSSRAAERVCSHAIQVFGGYGYLSDYPVERLYRDARVCQIYEGTNEVMQMVIARRLAGEQGVRVQG